LFLGTSARAEDLGIPHNEKFPAAVFPFARVLDGCTSWRRPAQLGDEWAGVSFKAACSAHDKCYHTINASWGECNRQFKNDLFASCRRDLKAARLKRGEVGDPTAESMKMCFDIANMYFSKVQSPEVIRRFKIAQLKQNEYIESIFKVLSDTFEKDRGRKPTNSQLSELFKRLMDGNSIEQVASGIQTKKSLSDQNRESEPPPVLQD
jgi:hypothetical protein